MYTSPMRKIQEGVAVLFQRRDGRYIALSLSALFFFSILLVQNGSVAIDALSFTSLSLSTRLSLFLTTLFDTSSNFSVSALLLALLGSIVGALNISLAYVYMTMRGRLILRSGLYSGMGLLLAFLGLGCAACGTALLGVLLSFLGLSSFLSLLPYGGQEIGYVGLVVLLVATSVLARKVATPNVC